MHYKNDISPEESFSSLGWCKYNHKSLDGSIEFLIDEILELSHTIFGRKIPKLGSLKQKSSYLSETLFEFSCLDRSKVSFIYDAVKNLPSFHGLFSSPALLQKCQIVMKSEKLITIKESTF